MLNFGFLSGTETSTSRGQRTSRQSKSFGFGRSLFSLGALLLLAGRSTVNAVNADKISFQIIEIDSPLKDIMWCGSTNDIVLVHSQAGTVYRSRDKCDSWKKLHSIMHQTGMAVLDDGQSVSTRAGPLTLNIGHRESQENDAKSGGRQLGHLYR